jgi:hypothetical protein
MTTEVVSAAMVPSRAAWRSLPWSAPLTALWVLLTYKWPAIPPAAFRPRPTSSRPTGFIAVGLWLGLEYTSLTPGHAARPGWRS